MFEQLSVTPVTDNGKLLCKVSKFAIIRDMKQQDPICSYCHKPIEDRLLIGGRRFANVACKAANHKRFALRLGLPDRGESAVLTGHCAVCGRELYTTSGAATDLMYCPKYNGKPYCSDTCRAGLRVIRRRKVAPERACGVCGSSFQAKRADAKFCSLKCRQRAHRSGQEYQPADLSERQKRTIAAEQERREQEHREMLQKMAELSKAIGRNR